MKDNLNVGPMIGGMTLTCILNYNVYIFFESSSIMAKSLSAGSFTLLLFLLIPFWSQTIKTFKQNRKRDVT